MNDQQRRDAFMGGLIGGFAAVGVVMLAMNAVQTYQQQKLAEQLQQGQSGGLGGGLNLGDFQ